MAKPHSLPDADVGSEKAMAIALAEAGADIVGVSAQLESEGSDIEREITALGRSFRAYQCDFANRVAVREFARQVEEECPPIDILVNNAGTILRNPAAEHSDEYWDTVIEVNLNSQFILSREIGRQMLERGNGKIIFTASLLTFQGGITVPGYAASKGGIGQTDQGSGPTNGQAVASTSTRSRRAISPPTTRPRCEPIRSVIPPSSLEFPAGRWGDPDDFKGTVVFLASSASDYLHGSIILVDGGWLAR